jgi:hypothetical protein
MYLSISFRKLTPQRNHQLNLWISNSEQQDDDFGGEGDFLKLISRYIL